MEQSEILGLTYEADNCIKKRKSDNKIKRGIRYGITFRDMKTK